MTIRLLSAQDGAEYQQLRLEALEHDPDVFLSTLESETAKHESSFGLELDYAYHPPYFGYYGLFIDDQLAGYCQVDKSYLDKQLHVAFLYNLYIRPRFRKQHLASQLLAHVKAQLTAHEHVELIYLSCAAANKVGIQFYKANGFKRCGIKPKSIKWQGKYDDEIEMVCVLGK